MRSKSAMTLWLIMAFLTLHLPSLAQKVPLERSFKEKNKADKETLEKWPEEKILSLLDGIKPGEESEFYWCSELHRFGERAAGLKSDKIIMKILNIPDFSECISQAKITTLSNFKSFPGVHDYVIKCLNMQSIGIQQAAAATLLKWGEWDLAAPVICKTEDYMTFQNQKDDRAIPLLEDAVKHGSWKGRIYAAYALSATYGDSTKLPQVALDIILHAPLNTTDKSINVAKYLALEVVPRFNLIGALPGIINNAREEDYGISSLAVGYLLHFSDLGYQEATQALRDISETHSNAIIREQAKQCLSKIEQKDK